MLANSTSGTTIAGAMGAKRTAGARYRHGGQHALCIVAGLTAAAVLDVSRSGLMFDELLTG